MSINQFSCDVCEADISAVSEYLAVYSNEQYYPSMGYICEECKPAFGDHRSVYQEGFRKGKSQGMEQVRREVRELKERLRITTELLEATRHAGTTEDALGLLREVDAERHGEIVGE